MTAGVKRVHISLELLIKLGYPTTTILGDSIGSRGYCRRSVEAVLRMQHAAFRARLDIVHWVHVDELK